MFLFIVEDKDLYPMTGVAMDMMVMADFTFAKLFVPLKELLGILKEEAEFPFWRRFDTTDSHNFINELFYRGTLAHFDELRIHAVGRVNVKFDNFVSHKRFVVSLATSPA